MFEKNESEFLSVNVWRCEECGTAWRRDDDNVEPCPVCGASNVKADVESGIDELMEIREFDEQRFDRKWPETWIHD